MTEPSAAEIEALFHQGVTLHSQSRFEEALGLYDQTLRLGPSHFGALYLSGVIALQQHRLEQAIDLIGRAIRVNPAIPDAHHDYGRAQFELRRSEEALRSYDTAIALKPGYAEAYYNRGTALYELRRYEAAIASYDKAFELECEHAGGYFNRGAALHKLKQYAAAVASFDKAIALKPVYPDAYNDRGMALQEMRLHEAALESFEKAIAQRSHRSGGYLYNRGNALDELKRYEAAIASYDEAIALEPNLKFIAGTRLLVKMKISDWSNLEADVSRLGASLERDEAASPPLAVLVLSQSARLQRKAAESWLNDRGLLNRVSPATTRPTRHGKIRVGYFSPDFRNHAVSLLCAGLMETHDRSRFEVIGFSLGPDTQDEMRKRMERAFDDFLDVKAISDQQIATHARERELDIAIDLGGLTEGSRPEIFALRAAPLQVNFLGYPGTTGLPAMDYLVADRRLIPTSSQCDFSEKIIYLPNSYQVNDATRGVSDKAFTREEFGLPPRGFVFCCFNNGYKITPSSFDGWMRILRRVDDSVLWLLEDNAVAVRNLRQEAARRGIDGQRLIFAKRMGLPDHLARQRLADLFLDTLPYNAHTTASDALWVGLPVITCVGESFASRVAASLLNAIGLPELVTSSAGEYEELAVELAFEPRRLAEIKNKLTLNRLTTPLFDVRLFTKNIETAYIAIHERRQAGRPADHLDVRLL